MRPILSQYSNLSQRLITAVIGAAILLFCTAYSEWTYFAVFLFITFMTLREFYKLIGIDGFIPLRTLGVIAGLGIFSLSFLIEFEHISYRYYFLIFPLLSLVYMIKLYKKFERKPFTNIAYTFLGVFYVAIPFALLNIAAFENGSYNYQVIIGPLLILWASDVGAYFAGISIGRRKLFERISPKKTWEGFLGGASLAAGMAYGVAFYFTSLLPWQWYVIAAIMVIGGTYGDLVESLLKRSIEIKDSGTSLPGHGGFLDRFDSLLISAPFIVAFIEIF
jgi:phosphatidate cytidylyltransferase